ncbi:hypothetical protein M1I50_09550 [Clostridioides difficile]|uniref:hypothetical protein n=1 Tax=Clostridioides difficile TaxID=1496 RepID=UPI000D1E09EB|nr:hypothetical protein [Clostridioides difficile]MBZ4494430.1 hypothetical protein [Clostridioides difficile]MCL0943228.1 hypothetical protein [Clostridioides difficile]MCM4101002.1 hypothetical protein [Clostridioides difficile]MDI2845771.1 hypothetical protein [Clostridioides difficile]HBG2116853.1 hypothetical protein [Clostridioides difficile]
MKNNKGTVLEKCEIVKQEDGTYKFIEHLKDGDNEVLLSEVFDKYIDDTDLNITIRLSETIVK